jgi:hypothetical protein
MPRSPSKDRTQSELSCRETDTGQLAGVCPEGAEAGRSKDEGSLSYPKITTVHFGVGRCW